MLCLPGVRDLGSGADAVAACPAGGARHGLLDVGGVVAVVAGDQRVLARLGQHLELVRQRAADGAGVGLDRAELQPAAREDARVRVVHVLVLALGVGLVDVERVGVLHDELAPAHEAGARPQLVAELGLDLVEVQRQLPLAAHVARTSAQITSSCVGPMTKSPPLRSLKRNSCSPYFSQRPDSCHSSAGMTAGRNTSEQPAAVQLLADDAFDLGHHPPAERQERIDPGRHLAQVAAAHHEDVRRDLRFRRGFLEGRDQGLGHPHVEGY